MSARLARRPRVVAHRKGTLPESLAGRVLLLAYDPTTGRLAARSRLGLVLRAAVLVDLQLAGHLTDEDDRVVATPASVIRTPGPASATRGSAGSMPGATAWATAGAAREPRDPVAAKVLGEVRAGGRRRWKYWVERHHRKIVREVRAELERARLIRVEPYRRFGVFPAERITLRQPLVRRQLLRAATDALRPARLVTRIDLRDAALVVLAATGDLRTVVTKEQKNRHKDRLAQLTVRVGPAAPALRKALQNQSAAAAGG